MWQFIRNLGERLFGKFRSFKKHGNVQTMRERKQRNFAEEMECKGFKRVHDIGNGVGCCWYHSDAVSKFRHQICATPSGGLISRIVPRDMYTHPMNSEIGICACSESKRFIKG